MRHTSIKFYCYFQVLLFGVFHSIFAEVEALTFDTDTMNVVLRETAMPELGDSRLEKILTRYYKEGLGGPDHWKDIESLSVSGILEDGGQLFKISAYQKKPNLIKMTVRNERNTVVLGYDGKIAWIDRPKIPNSQAEEMPGDQARKFIHTAHFGNHLLYPYKEGKTISYIDTVPVEGKICHHIRVILEDTEHQVDYYIDIRSYLEIKITNTDLRNQSTSTTVYTEYIREFGMPIAKSSLNYENGELTSKLTLSEFNVNSGVMPWMFRMPD